MRNLRWTNGEVISLAMNDDNVLNQTYICHHILLMFYINFNTYGIKYLNIFQY